MEVSGEVHAPTASTSKFISAFASWKNPSTNERIILKHVLRE